MTTWIIAGSSPSIVHHFDAVVGKYADATTFACNSSIKLFAKPVRRPDYFIAVDETAGIILHDHIWDAIERGTKFVSYSNSLLVRNLEGKISLPGYEVQVPLPTVPLSVGGTVKTTYKPGKVVFAQYSGLAAMQYALQQGANKIAIIGCDGYAGGNPGVDFPIVTFDGHGGDSHGERQTREVIAPFMQSMVEQCSDVEFIQYGDPRYTIVADNYSACGGVRCG